MQEKMVSIVTGTLNRKNFLPNLIANTVDANEKIELVLVDGGSDDGTIEYIETLNHPRIKFIKIGHRSSYPHFMNTGIQHATNEWVCQWNDDVILINNWDEIFKEIETGYDFYLFNWKYGNNIDINNNTWLFGDNHHSGWCLLDDTHKGGEIVMNYGLYNKNIFRKIGMYNNSYQYYYADGDMAFRAHQFGFKHKSLRNIKVCSLLTDKKATHFMNDEIVYHDNISLYKKGVLPENIEYLV